MILTTGLTYSYGETKMVFPDLLIDQGNHLLLHGESGCGKTTLLHLMGGLLKVQQGTIEVGGTKINSLPEMKLDTFRGKHIGYVFQKNHLISALSVFQNLLMVPFLSGLATDANWIIQVLEKLGLQEKKNARIGELSHGQAQRVAIARALLNKPSVIFADEPTSALDDKNCGRVIELLLEVAEWNKSILVIASHDQRLKSRIQNQAQLG